MADSPIPTWEYLTVICEWSTLSVRWVPRYVNGVELPNWKRGDGLITSLDKWGAEGWELVTAPVTHSASPAPWTLIFKRPRSTNR